MKDIECLYILRKAKGDGNCLFRSLLAGVGIDDNYHFALRQHICENLRYVKNSTFENMLLADNISLEEYTRKMKKHKEYGNHPELVSFANLTNFKLTIFRRNLQTDNIDSIQTINETGNFSVFLLFTIVNADSEQLNHFDCLIPKEREELNEDTENAIKNLISNLEARNSEDVTKDSRMSQETQKKVKKLASDVFQTPRHDRNSELNNVYDAGVEDITKQIEKLTTKQKKDLMTALKVHSSLDKIKTGIKRKFSQAFVEKVVDEANEKNNNLYVSKIHSIPESTVRHWRNKFTNEKELSHFKQRRQLRQRSQAVIKFETELIQWFKDMREKKLPVENEAIRKNAIKFAERCSLNKKFKASYKWLSGFKKRYRIVLRKATHVATSLTEYAIPKIKEFLNEVREIKLDEIKRRYIDTANGLVDIYINLDETPMTFDQSKNQTMEIAGRKNVTILKNKKYRKYFSVLIGITSLGHFLNPFIILKGKNDPQVFTYQNLYYSTNERGWFTSEKFLQYLKLVILPLKKQNPNIILIFDNFSGHKSPEVLNWLNHTNIRYIRLPAGCTSILQPIDVTINHPLKTYLRKKNTEYIANLFDNSKIIQEIKSPEQTLLFEWILEFFSQFPKESVEMSFKHCGINLESNEIHLINKNLLNQSELQSYFESLKEEDFLNLEGIDEILNKEDSENYILDTLIEEVETLKEESSASSSSEEKIIPDAYSSEDENQKPAELKITKVQVQTSLDSFIKKKKK